LEQEQEPQLPPPKAHARARQKAARRKLSVMLARKAL
jgi:hypothetical protein